MRIGFGDCEFDSATRELFRRGKRVHLSPKAYLLLELLLENHPRALGKAEIQEHVWPGVFISEANLAGLVSELRRAIGEKGRTAGLLRTVHGFGYAFSGEIARRDGMGGGGPSRRHSLFVQNQEIRLNDGANVVGRDTPALVRIDDPTVSRRHASLSVAGATVTVEDLGSKNGSFIDGNRLRPGSAETVRSGSVLRFGSIEAILKTSLSDESTETVRPGPPGR
jgi:DNA-binding winged helix-turn-helix (wHTH) protein